MVHFAHDKCSSGIFDYNFKFWILGNYYSCDDWVVNYENQLRPILTQMDIEWTPFSDFVVDVSSQKYEGIFNKFNHPFAAAPLQPYFGQMGVTHMNIDGLMPSPWSIT